MVARKSRRKEEASDEKLLITIRYASDSDFDKVEALDDLDEMLVFMGVMANDSIKTRSQVEQILDAFLREASKQEGRKIKRDVPLVVSSSPLSLVYSFSPVINLGPLVKGLNKLFKQWSIKATAKIY